MKKTFTLLFLCLISVCSFGQNYVLDSIKLQPFWKEISIEDNVLKYADESPYFQYFFDKLDSLYEGKTEKMHIFHIGGSHIQADFYSNKLRTYLQNMNEVSTSQRGFVFPYHLAHTNNPLSYRVEATKEKWKGYRCSTLRDSVAWGLSGVTAVFKSDEDTIRIRSNYRNYTKKCYDFNKLRIFYNTWRDDYELTLTGATVLKDTINYQKQYREFTLDTDLEEVTVHLKLKDPLNQDPEFLMMGLELMNDKPGIEYTSIGANGASFNSYTRCAFFEDQLSVYKPDMFIISIGTNDAYKTNFDGKKFEADYEGFIKMIQRVNPDCAILLTVPNDSYFRKKAPNKNTAVQEEIILKLAQKYKMAVWDFYKIMGGYGSSQKWYANDLMIKDRIHFTQLGYSIKGDLLLDAFIHQWEQNTHRPKESLLTYFKSLGE